MTREKRDAFTLLLVAAVVFTVNYRSIPLVMDSVWTVPIAMSIIEEGNTDLNEYRESVIYRRYYGIEMVGTHIESYFPIGTPILVVPFVYIISRYAAGVRSFDLYEHLKTFGPDEVTYRIELFLASLIVALVAAIIYLIARRSLSRAQSLLLVAVFAFGTSVWSTAGRALWQHGPSMLMLSLTLYILLRAKDDPRWAQFAGLTLALSYVIRPTNSISILALTILVFLQYRRYFVRYILWAAIVAVPFVMLNLRVYGALLPSYYAANRIGTYADLGNALLGNLVSPSRGLFVFSPIFILIGYGIVLKIRAGEFTKLDGALAAILPLHWIAISSFPGWWGGSSYGPRLFTDMVPYLTYFLIPVVAKVTLPRQVGDYLLSGVFVCLALASMFIHYRGATQPLAFDWNVEREGIQRLVDATRVWDWRDPQFLRGLRPGRFEVEPQTAYLSIDVETLHATSPSAQAFRLRIRNLGDKSLSWRVTEPQGIHLQSSTSCRDVACNVSTVGGMQYRDLTFAVDVTGYPPGLYSLGGIRFDVFSQGSTVGDERTIVIPVSVNIVPLALRSATANLGRSLYLPMIAATGGELTVQERFVSPPDLLVNGQAQAVTPDRMHAVFGTGWFQIEHQDGASWRWAASPAELLVYSPSQQEITIEGVPAALRPPQTPRDSGRATSIHVSANGAQKSTIAAEIRMQFSLAARLRPGWNIITFESEAGNFRPGDIDPQSGDWRWLSFALSDLDIRER